MAIIKNPEPRKREINLLGPDGNAYFLLATADNLSKLIPKFTKEIYNVTEHICKKYEYLYDRLEFTGMWANKLKTGDVHPPHTHSNNVFSGVYYLEGGSQIQFFDPRPQASVLHPNLKYTNFDNSGMIGFNSSKGYGLIFPSWLTHWVPPTGSERVSISWNFIIRGKYGEANSLQDVNI